MNPAYKFIVKGGKPLHGTVPIYGSKNAASKLMIASLLTASPCRIENVPHSGEIEITKELCERVGSRVEFDSDRGCRIETREVTTSLVPELSRKNRIPILAIGPLLHRKGIAEVPILGGDPIGHRPIDFHLEALNKMGVRLERREHSYYAEAERIKGAEIEFPFPSVGATETVLLTSVLAEGETHLKNAALEPEVINLVEALLAMGARIAVNHAERSMVISGVSRLGGGTCRVMPDRNEIVSFAIAALATGGAIFFPDIKRDYIETFLQSINELGGSLRERDGGIEFFGAPPYRPIVIETSPHPGFMTDWASPFCVLLTRARGESIIHETIYEDRFGYTKDLKQMGADIEISDECWGGNRCRFAGRTFNHSARIKGPNHLKGTKITMTDIRAGMAHIIAALAAEGESVILGIEHIDRGYENIDGRLRELGADIRRV